MLQLAELIKDRINDVHQIKRIQEESLNILIGESKESMVHRRMPQVFTQIERKQNHRLKAEVSILQGLHSLSLTSQQTLKDFMTASLSVFRTYCPEFDHKALSTNELPNVRVHRLYREFLLRFANPFHFAHICAYLRREICELNAVIYLGWLGEWSRGLLAETLKRWGSSSQGLRLRTELSKIVRDKLGEERRKDAGEIFLHSRQNFYGYILPQLEEHYKRLDILDLDMSYLRSIKRIGRKEELLGINSSDSINFIIAKNNPKIAAIIKKYSDQYYAYMRKTKKARRLPPEVQHTDMVRLKTIKSYPTKQIIRQDNIENSDLCQKMKRPKRSKILLGSAYQRIQFPIIQSAANNKDSQHFSRGKKSLKRVQVYKTEAQEPKDNVFFNDNNITPKAFFKKQANSLIAHTQVKIFDNPTRGLLFQYNSIETEFHRRRQSIIHKVQQKGISLSSKGSKISLPSGICFDDQVLKKVREGLFLSEKNCKL